MTTNPDDKKPKQVLATYAVVALIVMFLLNIFVLPGIMERSIRETTYSDFLKGIDSKQIQEVQFDVQDSIIYYTLKQDGKTQVCKTGLINTDSELIDKITSSGADLTSEIPTQQSPLMNMLIGFILPTIIFIFLGQLLFKKMTNSMTGGPGGAMSFGKSNAKVYVKSSTGIKFSDEAEVPFFSISGSEFVEMFVGMGAAKVRDLFKQASEKAPCIVFIDEIDTIGKKRDGQISGNDEREQTLNQLLTEMDGFDGSKGVVILAATNRPDSLDPALTRPGRFDRRIPVELPDLQGREDILKVHARKIKIADNVNFHEIAKAASGASGAELANIVNEAALRAVRDGRRFATQADLEESIEVVIAGYQKKSRVLSEKEKLIVSYHEVGHALVAALQTNSAPVHKITIIPRTSGALGYTMQVEEGERFLMSKEEMANKIATLTGGRAAEEIIFHSITTGASNDIEQATKLARAMITRYGMSDTFDMVAMETVANQYLGGDSSLSCSPETQTQIDTLTVDLVKAQHQKAIQLLQDNLPKLHEIAKYLYEHETITGEEFMTILMRKPELAAADSAASGN